MKAQWYEAYGVGGLGAYPKVNGPVDEHPGPDFTPEISYQVGNQWFTDMSAAIEAADESIGQFIEWQYGVGHVHNTPEMDADIEAWADEAKAS